eukprot:TRINITY_DN17_c0_g1_i2.p1 TRINITY_DN17_c0_g1~~TRINITY_DN17_c0_g1_i2.p1  ORF type:complete len:803 (+),score=309.87 TRINITY_DN17_c0_g1_i2:169-2577(+)
MPSVAVFSWNVGHAKCADFPIPSENTDIRAICLQETHRGEIDQFVSNVNERNDGYNTLLHTNAEEMVLIVQLRAGVSVSLSEVKVTKYIANNPKIPEKGFIIASFLMDDLRYYFISSHLPANRTEQHLQHRIDMVQEVMNHLKKNHPKLENGVVFWGGDLNFRYKISSEDSNIEWDALTSKDLLEQDELKTELASNPNLEGFQEQEIHFEPTYKYIVGSDNLTKDRIPAFCDRVLYKLSGEGVKVEERKYFSKRMEDGYSDSDHRPVIAEFEVSVENIRGDDEEEEIEIEIGNDIDFIDINMGDGGEVENKKIIDKHHDTSKEEAEAEDTFELPAQFAGSLANNAETSDDDDEFDFGNDDVTDLLDSEHSKSDTPAPAKLGSFRVMGSMEEEENNEEEQSENENENEKVETTEKSIKDQRWQALQAVREQLKTVSATDDDESNIIIEEEEDIELDGPGNLDEEILEEDEEEEESEYNEEEYNEDGQDAVQAAMEMFEEQEEAEYNKVEEEEEERIKQMQEWDDVSAQRAKELENREKMSSERVGISGTTIKRTGLKPISVIEAIRLLKNEDYSDVEHQIVVERLDASACGCFGRKKSKLFRIDGGDSYRKFAFCLAKRSLVDANETHMRIFQTMHKKLTGGEHDVPRFSSAWQSIGFQGSNPATDLRAVGMFGPLQVLSFIESYHTLAIKLHQLSQDDVQNFPFVVSLFNISLLTLQMLRDGTLFPVLNKMGDVFKGLNKFFAAMVYRLYIDWKRNGCTVTDFHFLMKEIEGDARKKPNALLTALDKSDYSGEVITEGTLDF